MQHMQRFGTETPYTKKYMAIAVDKKLLYERWVQRKVWQTELPTTMACNMSSLSCYI